MCKLKIPIFVFPKSPLFSLLLYIRYDCYSFSGVVTVSVVFWVSDKAGATSKCFSLYLDPDVLETVRHLLCVSTTVTKAEEQPLEEFTAFVEQQKNIMSPDRLLQNVF